MCSSGQLLTNEMKVERLFNLCSTEAKLDKMIDAVF